MQGEMSEDVVRTGTLAQRTQAYRADKAKKAGVNLKMDPDTGTPDHFTAAMRRKKGLPEEAQLDELSGATLGSYVVKSKKDEKARKEHGIAVRDEIRKKTGLNVGTPMDPKLYGRKMSRGHNQQVAMKKLTGQARVNATEEVAVNSVGSGQVAGLQGEPPVMKKKKNVMSFNRFMKK
jgi:hypothetical protein